ncbi:hypothetical protein BMS3Bbin04_00871 [bacterium BMS3Bbin04]|nr:hypothetical protein BMS3Bbin04_00871 [bacterium BMS3Bbin04]
MKNGSFSWREKIFDFVITVTAVSIGGFLALQSSIATEVWNKKTEKVAELAAVQIDLLDEIELINNIHYSSSESIDLISNLHIEIEKDVLYLRTIRAGTYDGYMTAVENLHHAALSYGMYTDRDSLESVIDSLMTDVDIRMLIIRRSIYNQNPMNLLRKRFNDELYNH